MRRTNAAIFASVVALAAITAFLAAGCLKSNPPVSNEAPKADESAIPKLTGELSDTASWQTVENGVFKFSQPADWKLETGSNDTASMGLVKQYLRLKNTDKLIVLGGAAPDDYYMEVDGVRSVNTNKYADSYAIITVDVYEGYKDKDWTQFFNDAYSGTVSEYADFQLPAVPELKAVAAKTVSGIYFGEPRFFVKSGDKIYDVALYSNNMDKVSAERVFNSFVKSFNF